LFNEQAADANLLIYSERGLKKISFLQISKKYGTIKIRNAVLLLFKL